MNLKKIKESSVAFEAPAPLVVPEGALVTRDQRGVATGATPLGLDVIRRASAEGYSQTSISNFLCVSQKVLERLLGKADAEPMSAEREAWEKGQGDLKSELVRLCLAGARRGGLVQSLFLLKSLFQFRDQGPQVALDVGPRINFTLPAPVSEQQYYESLGITGPVDTRDPKVRAEMDAAMGRPQLQIEHQPTTGEPK